MDTGTSGGTVSLRGFFSWPILAVMIAGGMAVMLGTAFAGWPSVQQNVAGWAWLVTVACYRALWLLFGQRDGKDGPSD